MSEPERQGRWRTDAKTLPHNTSAEASVLGGIIIRNEVLSLLPMLEVDDFYDPRHRVVFQAIRNCEATSRPIDVVTLESEIERAGKLDAVGGVAFLGELTLLVPTSDNVEAYAAIVVEHRVTRDTIRMLYDLAECGYSGESAGEQLVHDVGAALMRIRTAKDTEVSPMGGISSDEGHRVFADVEQRAKGGFVYAGIPTGFTIVDERLGGHPVGVMTLYIARPGAGKSTVAMAVAKAAVEIGGADTLIASYEDGMTSFAQRAIAQESGVPTERIRARKITHGEEMRTLAAGIERASGRRELFIQASGMEVEQLIRRVRRENLRRRTEGKPRIKQLIVDYIQKIPLPERARSREEGIGHISHVLSTFAATDDMAVVVMSQLNREAEKRDDHRPRLSDIRDSGAIEQNGKLIFGLYHPHTYEPKKFDETVFNLLVLKNAQGEATNEIELYWDRKTHAIYNSALEYQRHRAERGR